MAERRSKKKEQLVNEEISEAEESQEDLEEEVSEAESEKITPAGDIKHGWTQEEQEEEGGIAEVG